MFIQCTNCQAIFRVSMREVTVSNGLLRCGECNVVFDSSKSISTTMQKPFQLIDGKDKARHGKLSEENLQTISALDDWQNSSSETATENKVTIKQSPTKKSAFSRDSTNRKPLATKVIEKAATNDNKIKSTNNKWPFIAAGVLGIILISQVVYNYRHLYLDTLRYEPEKIQMLNHNVFAHPIEKGVLLISASIQNTADFDQSFPILEVRLTNSKSKLVALRRFSPDEYLDNYSAEILLIKNRATSIKLKIQDPGNQATRFQFDFL